MKSPKCAELWPQQCEGLVDLEAGRVVFGSYHPRRVTAGREERRVDVELAVEHVQLGVLEVEQGVVVGHDGCRRLADEDIVETCEMCRTSTREDQQETWRRRGRVAPPLGMGRRRRRSRRNVPRGDVRTRPGRRAWRSESGLSSAIRAGLCTASSRPPRRSGRQGTASPSSAARAPRSRGSSRAEPAQP